MTKKITLPILFILLLFSLSCRTKKAPVLQENTVKKSIAKVNKNLTKKSIPKVNLFSKSTPKVNKNLTKKSTPKVNKNLTKKSTPKVNKNLFSKSTPKVNKNTVTILVTSSDSTLGYVSQKEVELKKGETITITSTAFNNAKFIKWSGDTTDHQTQIDNNKITFNNVQKDIQVRAHFLPLKVSFSIKDKFNRTTKVDGYYSYGSYLEWKVKTPYYITDRIRYITFKPQGQAKLKKDTIIEIKWIKQYFVEIKEDKEDYDIVGFPGGWVNADKKITFNAKIKRKFAKFSHWIGVDKKVKNLNPLTIAISNPLIIKPYLDIKKVKVYFINENGIIAPFKEGIFDNGTLISWNIPKNKIIKPGVRVNNYNPTGSVTANKDLVINPDWFKQFKISTFTNIEGKKPYLSTISWQREGQSMIIKAEKKIGQKQFAYWSGDITKEQQYKNPLIIPPSNSPRKINAHYKKKIVRPIVFNPFDSNITHTISTGSMKIITEKNDDLFPLRYLDHNGILQLYGYYPKGTIIDFKATAPIYVSYDERYNITNSSLIEIGKVKVIKFKWKKEFLVKNVLNNVTNGKVIRSIDEWAKEGEKFVFPIIPIAGKIFYNWSGSVPQPYLYNKVIEVIADKPLVINLNYQNDPYKISQIMHPFIKKAPKIALVELNNWNDYGSCIKLTTNSLEVIISVNLGQVVYYGLPKEAKNFLWANVVDKTLNKRLYEYAYNGQSIFVEPQKLARFKLKQKDSRLDGIKPTHISINNNHVELVFSRNKYLSIFVKKVFILGEKTLYTKTLFFSDSIHQSSKYLLAPSIVSKFIKPQNILLEDKKTTKLTKTKIAPTKEGKFMRYDISNYHNFKIGSRSSNLIMDYGKHKINIITSQKASDYYPNKDSAMTFKVPKNGYNFIEVAANGSYEYINKNANSYSETAWVLDQ